ncbi:serine protease 1-like [Drosophila willistoni]|uniref:serine protease 1-like n=1 Tax=Drosophila willistoni TaxID=7260 RepID=UPI000C26D555|nr:serine protease 1-like [Drosophila willistoni]
MDSVQIFYGYNLYGISEISHTVGKKNFISHEQYGHSGPGPFDIGLIRTPNRIEFSAKISKIALPKLSDQSDSMVGWNTKSCGWGSTTETVYPYHLQCMDVNVISNGECFKLFSHFNDFKNITDDMVCTGLIKGKAVCGGDSGGPLVTRSNPPTLVGVVSFGSEACDAASVYARVSYFLKWIHEKTDIPI